jgi:hypothetical protein
VTASTARAVIDAASFSSGHPQRDKDVKSANLLHVQEHPHIKFASSELVPVGEKQFLFLVSQTPFFALKVMRVSACRLRVANKAM